MKKIIWVIIILLIIWGIVALGGGENELVSEEPIKIGAILPLTGNASFYGEYGKQGLELALEDINNDGGVNGHPLEIVYEDSLGQPKAGLQAINKLIFEGFKVIIGDIISGVTLTMAPVAEKNKVILIANGSATPKMREAGDYIFRTKASADIEVVAGIDFIEKLKVDEVAFLYQNSEYGTSIFNTMKSGLQKIGINVDGEERFEIGTTDMRTQLTKLMSSDSDYIILAGYPKQIGFILKQADELGMSKNFFAHSGSIGPDIIKVAGDSAEDLIFLYESQIDNSQKRTLAFFENYRRKYNEEPELFSMIAYDTLFVLRDKIEECSLDTDCIKDSLYNTKNFEGISGKISFDKNGDIIREFFTPMTIKQGRFIKYEE